MAARVDWSRFGADPRRAEVAGVRASDADREVALEILREAYADGRLDRPEHDQRSATALSVRLLGELVPLLQDLEPPVPAVRSVGEEALRRYRREERDARNGVVVVAVITTGIWAITSIASGGLTFFWPVFPIGGVGIGWLMVRLNREQRLEELEQRVARKRERRRRREARED